MELKDSEDRTYVLEEDLHGVRRSFGLGDDYIVAPGERISGEAGFEIPLDARGLVFTFAGDEGKAFFVLGEGPELADPPATIPGQAEGVIHEARAAVAVGVVELTVHGASFSATNADPGFQFASVDISVRNISSDALDLTVGSPRDDISVWVKDALGFVYSRNHAFADQVASSPVPEGNFAPGERKRGSIVFEVPQDATGLVLVFEPGAGDKVFMDVPDEDS